MPDMALLINGEIMEYPINDENLVNNINMHVPICICVGMYM